MDGYEFGSFKVPKWWWLDASMLNLFHQGRRTGFYPLVGVRDRGLIWMALDSESKIKHGNQIHREHHLSMGIRYTNYVCRSLNFIILHPHVQADDDVIGDLRSQWDHLRSSFPGENLPETRSYYPRAIKHGNGFPHISPFIFWWFSWISPVNPPLLRGFPNHIWLPEGNCKYPWLRRRRIMINLPETLIYWSFRKSPYHHQPLKNEKKWKKHIYK